MAEHELDKFIKIEN